MSQYTRDIVIGDASGDEFAGINFDELECRTKLNLSDGLRNEIRYRLSMYEFEIQSFENIPAQDVKRELNKVAAACDLLESMLRIRLEPGGGINAEAVKQAVWTCSSPNSLHASGGVDAKRLPGDLEVAEFLKHWKKNAVIAQKVKGKAGRPRNSALLLLLRSLHDLFVKAGGEGRGCTRSEYADDGYEGKFLVFSNILLEYSSVKIQRSQLAEFIIENCDTD